MATQVSFEKSIYKSTPKKFEAGTPPFEEIVACGTLIDFVSQLEMSRTAAYEKELLQYATVGLSEIKGVKIYGTSSEREPLVSFGWEGKDEKKLEKYLKDEFNIAVRAGTLSAQPLMKHLGVKGLLRVSFCYYNTKEEIDLLIKAIESFEG